MSTPATKTTEIIIVGGGPVGMGLAIELGRRGVHCILVERYEAPQPIPKGQNLTQRTMEHFHFWGVEQAVRAARTIPTEYGIGGLTAYGELLGDYSYDWMQRELVRPFYFKDNERLPQYATETALRQRVRELATVETLYGWAADDVSQDEGGVTVHVTARGGSSRQALRGKYVVGCDGSRSIVRERCGITQTLSDHDKLMVLLVFRSEALHRLLQRYPGKSYYCVLHPDLKGYWRFFGRVDLGSTWFFHAPVPPGTTKDNYDFRALLHAAAGAEFEVAFEHIGFWELRFAIADTYRAGRAFIAGDAAHSHPPYGGYGINTGLEDARNLGWKLAASLQGWAGDGLLASYDAERRPVFQSTARDFIEKAIEADRTFLEQFDPRRDRAAFERAWKLRQSGATAEVHAFEPHYEGSPVVSGPAGAGACSAVGSHAFKARAGHHLAPQPLSTGRSIFEELGGGFTLLALDADETVTSSFAQAAASLGVPLRIVRDTRSGGREKYEAAFVLVRPDEFVAWTSNAGPVDAAAVLERSIGGKPHPPPSSM
jgi:2-polyprenyl-6-methoxyphenol hydroxylase-like FAD-dependent oxidoreductase